MWGGCEGGIAGEGEMTRQKLANAIARHIFECGSEPNRPTTRLQFKSGVWPDNERSEGGLCEIALARVIADALIINGPKSIRSIKSLLDATHEEK